MNNRESLKEFSCDGVNYVCPSWNQMGDYTFNLAQKINQSGRKFDRMVALAKGGWTWSRTLADNLNIDKLSSTRLKSYDGVKQSNRVKILQPLSDPIDGENVLIFDEVVDSGETIIKAREYVELLGAQEVAVATLCYKPKSKVIPEFYAFSTNAWVVFPHNRREFITDRQNEWSQNNVPAEMIKSRLVRIGLPKNQVEYFLSKNI